VNWSVGVDSLPPPLTFISIDNPNKPGIPIRTRVQIHPWIRLFGFVIFPSRFGLDLRDSASFGSNRRVPLRILDTQQRETGKEVGTEEMSRVRKRMKMME